MYALEVLHDDMVRRDMHLWARRVAGGDAEGRRVGRARRSELRGAVHVDVVVAVDLFQMGDAPTRGHCTVEALAVGKEG